MTQRDIFLPFARPDIDGTELAEIQGALESGWVTTGPKTGHGITRNNTPLSAKGVQAEGGKVQNLVGRYNGDKILVCRMYGVRKRWKLYRKLNRRYLVFQSVI